MTNHWYFYRFLRVLFHIGIYDQAQTPRILLNRMINKEIMQCRLCGVRFGAGTHFNSLMSHWKQFHERSGKCAESGKKFSKLLDHIRLENEKAERLGLKNEGLVDNVKEFSKAHPEENCNSQKKSKQDELHLKKFAALMKHIRSQQKKDDEILRERSENGNNRAGECSNVFDSEDVHSLALSQQLKTKSKALPRFQLQCKHCPLSFSDPVEAVCHYQREHSHIHREETSMIDKNNNSEKGDLESDHDNSQDKENEMVKQPIIVDEASTLNQESKFKGDDIEDVILISDDNSDCPNEESPSLKRQGKDKTRGGTMVKSKIDYSGVAIIDLTGNGTRDFEEILNQGEIIKKFLSRSASSKTYEKDVNKLDIHEKRSPSSPGTGKEKNLKKSKSQEGERRKRSQDEKQVTREKKRVRKCSKEKAKSEEDSGEVRGSKPKETEEGKTGIKEKHDPAEETVKAVETPKNKNISPWEELIWNSTKDPKYSKQSAKPTEKGNDSPTTNCEETYRPKPLRRQSARKSCSSKQVNKVDLEAIRRITREGGCDGSQWPFSVDNIDSSSDDQNCSQSGVGIWNCVMSSVPFTRPSGMYKISREYPGRFLHRKLTADGREATDYPGELQNSTVQSPPETVRKRQTARKSTRSRPPHLQGYRRILLDNANRSECECHACGKIVSTDNEDLYQHYTKDCERITG